MDFTFSFGWFFFGLVVLIAGIIFVKFHQKVADNFGSGAASYDRYKLVALITCLAGILIMFNLHILVLQLIVSLIVPSR
jgi:hypothetical protein